ncbi:hypothetical protein [Sphingomonas sp.]|uniref:hypothetical protein n=1 Tax=Sphingomonas sp. TaxID=28214 RepID=UPI003F70A240
MIGWWGLKGFTDEAAERGEWHSFEVLGRPIPDRGRTAPAARVDCYQGRCRPVSMVARLPRHCGEAAAARAVEPAAGTVHRKRA